MKLQLDLHYGSQKTALPLSATPCSAPNAPLLNSLALSPSSCLDAFPLVDSNDSSSCGLLMVSKYAEGRRHLTDVTHLSTHLPWTCTALHHPRDTTWWRGRHHRQPTASLPLHLAQDVLLMIRVLQRSWTHPLTMPPFLHIDPAAGRAAVKD